MEKKVADLTIANYQMEDLIFMLTKNGYIVKIKQKDEDRMSVSVYEYITRVKCYEDNNLNIKEGC